MSTVTHRPDGMNNSLAGGFILECDLITAAKMKMHKPFN